MTDNITLEPCPFCGNTPKSFFMSTKKRNKLFPIKVRCINCGARSDWYMTMKDAAAAWNMRYTDRVHEEL